MSDGSFDPITLTPEQAAAVIRAFVVPGKSMPLPVFLAVAESIPTIPCEFIILSSDKKSILLFERPESDPIFSKQWHFSGGVQLSGMRRRDVWEVLRTGPKYGLAGAVFTEPIEIGSRDTPFGSQEEGSCPRGQECNIIHVVYYVDGGVGAGVWFPLEKLPLQSFSEGGLLGHHRAIIKEVLLPWIDRQSTSM